MRSLGFVSPVDTRSVQRLSETHFSSTPVIRELPRPIPPGLGSPAW